MKPHADLMTGMLRRGRADIPGRADARLSVVALQAKNLLHRRRPDITDDFNCNAVGRLAELGQQRF